jgi:hypothetical protein
MRVHRRPQLRLVVLPSRGWDQTQWGPHLRIALLVEDRCLVIDCLGLLKPAEAHPHCNELV